MVPRNAQMVAGSIQASKTSILNAEDSVPLIPGLPDDLAVQCLLRVRKRYHRDARFVCKRWNDLLQSQVFNELRRHYGATERWLYVLGRDCQERVWWRAFDPADATWHAVAKMPSESARSYGMSAEAFDGKLYVMGGAGWFRPSKPDVFRYDPGTDRWSRVADLEHARCYAVSGVVGSQLLVCGGMGGDTSGLLTSVEAYNQHDNRWTSMSSMPMEGDLENSAVVRGRLLIRHMRSVHFPAEPYAAAFEPASDTWRMLDVGDEFANGWHGPSAVLAGRLYMLDQVGGLRLMAFDEAASAWTPLGRLSAHALSPPCKIAALLGKLYIVGRGASMAVIDARELARMLPPLPGGGSAGSGGGGGGGGGGMVVARQIGGCGCAPSDVVLSCLVVDI